MLSRYNQLIRYSIPLQSFSGRYQPESVVSGKTHTTAGGGGQYRNGHRAAPNSAVCSELSSGKEATLLNNKSPATGTPNYSTMASSDRLGQWPAESDGEVAGEVSGFARLRNGRFNKVSGKVPFLSLLGCWPWPPNHYEIDRVPFLWGRLRNPRFIDRKIPPHPHSNKKKVYSHSRPIDSVNSLAFQSGTSRFPFKPLE